MQKRRVNIVTMGCSKNLVDSEVLSGQLERSSFEVFNDSDRLDCNVVIINTCGFILDAKEESIDMILDYAEARKNGKIDKLYVMGCLSERYSDELKAEIPEVDRYFGKFDLKEVIDELKAHYDPEYIYERKITTPSHYAYLKIAEGCSRSCAFCAIPLITGGYSSTKIESLLKETKYLAGKGVKELLVIAQDLSYYGIDLYGKNMLAELVRKISGVDEIEWIRLHYLYPSKFPLEILDIIRDNRRLCRYLDLPLQHISDSVLKRMRRRVTGDEIKELIDQIRSKVPGINLRTTMLVGFPGESQHDFNELKKFVEERRFNRLGVFKYSHEEGTYAGRRLSDDVPEEVKEARADEIMAIQQQISAQLNSELRGRTLKVIIDRKEQLQYIGRSEFDSPEVDGEVIINSPEVLKIGSFYEVKITGSDDYDLYGEVVDKRSVSESINQ